MLQSLHEWWCNSYLGLAVYGDQVSSITKSSTVLVISNHSSDLDTTLLSSSLASLGVTRTYVLAEPPSPSTATSLLKLDLGLGLYRTLPPTLGHCAADVDRGVDEIKRVVDADASRCKAVLVYPEGVASRSEEALRPWRLSVGVLASRLQWPCVPICITGAHRALPPLFVAPLPGR